MDNRFNGKLGEEYSLFRLACPHFDELEGKVQSVIRQYSASLLYNPISVLEVGCGPGYTTKLILDADPRIKVIAVDNEKSMIAQAEEYLRDYMAHGRVNLVVADALIYLKEDYNLFHKFDIFASAFTLHNFEDNYRAEVLRQIYAVLKPSGLFANADKYSHPSKTEHQSHLEWQIAQFSEVFHSIGRSDLVKLWTEHYLRDNEPDTLMDEKKFIELMIKIGFKDVKKSLQGTYGSSHRSNQIVKNLK